MPEHLHFEDDALVNPVTHHEESDVPMRALLIFGITVVVLGLVIHLMVWGIFKGLACDFQHQPLLGVGPLDLGPRHGEERRIQRSDVDALVEEISILGRDRPWFLRIRVV